MENPCKKDCPRRSSVCHSSCPDYDEYKRFLEHKKSLIRKSKVYDDYINIRKNYEITNVLKESVIKRCK